MRWIFACIFVVSAAGAALAQMQCEGRLIEVGAAAADVLRDCGPPQQRVRSERVVATGLLDSPGSEEMRIPVEEWTYEQPGQFVRKLVFESGKLVKIDMGNYPDLESDD
jgi:hypothetical protein